MIRATLKHDSLDLSRDRGALLALGGLLLLILIALWAGLGASAERYQIQQRLADQDARQRAEAAALTQALAAGEASVSRWRDPRNADVVGRRLVTEHAVLPPRPLGALAMGQSDMQATVYPVTLTPWSELGAKSELQSPSLLEAGRLDLSFVIVYLAPLVLIALSYALISGERESGQWRLWRAQGLRPGPWLALRLLLRLGLIALPALVIACGLVLARGGEQSLLRLALWTLVLLGYLFFWGALCAFVVSSSDHRSQALLALLGGWLLLVVVLPAMLAAGIDLASPAPSRIAYVDAQREAEEAASAQGSQLLASYLQDHPELSPTPVDPQDYFAQRYVVQRQVEEAVAPLALAFDDYQSQRDQALDLLRYLAPAVLASDALADATGTGRHRHQHFRVQAQDFHTRWREFFEPHILSRTSFSAFPDIPRFRYAEESATSLAKRVLLAALGLWLPGLLLAMLAAHRLRE